MAVHTGLDRVCGFATRLFRGKRIGLVAHPASVDRKLRHAAEIFRNPKWVGARTLIRFAPQHGWHGEAQDNMIEARMPAKVISLYGRVREPTARMLSEIDVMVVDLQDVGTRVYTFIQTLYLVMRASARACKSVVVLDRPNPIDEVKEGPTLDPAYASFVGLTPIPLRHGLTIGELARRYHAELGGDLTVIPMSGRRRGIYFEATGLPWVMPSPNMPTVDTAVVYPGTVLFEGTSVSEGRGTTKPFEIIGSPGVEIGRLVRELDRQNLPGVVFRGLTFQPTFNKHAGHLCGGVQLHVTSRRAFRPVLTGAALLKAFRKLDPAFRWKKPPYEYETKKYPIDILAGTDRLRKMVDADAPIGWFRDWFESDARAFAARLRAEGFSR